MKRGGQSQTNPNTESDDSVVLGGRAPERRNGVEAAMKRCNSDSASDQRTMVLQRFGKCHRRHRHTRRRIHCERNLNRKWKKRSHGRLRTAETNLLSCFWYFLSLVIYQNILFKKYS